MSPFWIILLFIIITLAALILGNYIGVLYDSYVGTLVPSSIVGGAQYAPHKKSHAPINVIKDLDQHPRSKSEKDIISLFETITDRKFPTVNPHWLRGSNGRTLELDGYCEELAIAVEFSGPQHTKWYSVREPYEDYFKRISRDEYKKKACAENGVKLIVIDMTISALHSGHRYNYVRSRLYDVGFITEEPVMYIPEQVVQPFRNETIEKELGLVLGEIY